MAIQPFLREIADETKPVAKTNLRALSALTASERDELRAAWPTIAVGRRRDVVAQLARLTRGSVEVDFSAVFIEALRDDDAGVRAASVRALWEYEGRDLVAPLAELLEHDAEPGVRATAATALGRYALRAELDELRPDDAAAVDDALRRAAENERESVEVRARAIEALGVRSEGWVTALIDEAHRAGNPRLHVGAIQAMGRNCDAAWLPRLLEDLRDDDEEVRSEAASALGEIGEDAATPHLEELLDDEDGEVRAAAIAAMGTIALLHAESAARRALDRLAAAPDAEISAAARSALRGAQVVEDTAGLEPAP